MNVLEEHLFIPKHPRIMAMKGWKTDLATGVKLFYHNTKSLFTYNFGMLFWSAVIGSIHLKVLWKDLSSALTFLSKWLVIVLTLPTVANHLDICSKMSMLQYKNSERNGTDSDSEPVWPQLNKRWETGSESHWALSALFSAHHSVHLRLPSGIIKLQTAWWEHPVIDLWWKTLNDIKQKIHKENSRKDPKIIHRPEISSTWTKRPVMGFHHKVEFTPAECLLQTSHGVQPFQRPGRGLLEPEINWPITALPPHGGRSVHHATDL